MLCDQNLQNQKRYLVENGGWGVRRAGPGSARTMTMIDDQKYSTELGFWQTCAWSIYDCGFSFNSPFISVVTKYLKVLYPKNDWPRTQGTLVDIFFYTNPESNWNVLTIEWLSLFVSSGSFYVFFSGDHVLDSLAVCHKYYHV